MHLKLKSSLFIGRVLGYVCTQAPHMRVQYTHSHTRIHTWEHHARRAEEEKEERGTGKWLVVCVNSATLRPSPLPSPSPPGPACGSNEGAVNFPHPLFLPVTFPHSAASPIIPPLHFRIGGAPSFEIGLEAVAASHSVHGIAGRSSRGRQIVD